MENEFNDEPRKCGQCGIVTYCDSCPICGKKLARSSMSTWKRKYGRNTAGEDEALLQSEDTGKLHEHIDIRDSQNAKFENAEHMEPEVNFHSDHVTPSHPYFTNDHVVVAKNMNRTILIIASMIAIIIGTIIIVGVGFSQYSSSESFFKSLSFDDKQYETLLEKKAIVDGRNEIVVGEYYFTSSEDESVMEITNNGNRTMKTDVILYQGDVEIGSYEDVFILPHEVFELSMYTNEAADGYVFMNYNFYDITATQPNFAYASFCDYGSVKVYAEDNIKEEDLKILLYFMQEASSFDEVNKLQSLNLYNQDETYYEVYLYEGNQVADVYKMDEYDGLIDSYELDLSGNSEENLGTEL